MKTLKTFAIITIFLISILPSGGFAQNNEEAFKTYYQSFKTLAKADITRQFIETDPYKQLTPITAKESMQWVVNPIIVSKLYFREGSQDLGQCMIDEIAHYNQESLENQRMSYYRYGRIAFSERYISLLYFYVNHEYSGALRCMLINYTKEGKAIDGLVIGSYEKSGEYEVNVTQSKPENVLLTRSLIYRWKDKGNSQKVHTLTSDEDHYYQFNKNGKIVSVQQRFYPYHGYFVDRKKNQIKVKQYKQGIWCKYEGRHGALGSGGVDKRKGQTIEKGFKVDIGLDGYSYLAIFKNKNKLVLTKPNGKSWTFSRTRRKF